MNVEELMKEKGRVVDTYIADYFTELGSQESAEIDHLVEAMKYSATNGGKRFRPALSLLIGEMLATDAKSILPFASAVEFIHTYSLIHDDLPCMDDDDERRGAPTNHKVYGEDIALIAGDGLQTEAFYIISSRYKPELASRLTLELAKASGHRGMVGGQAIDLKAQKEGIEFDKLHTLHKLKTGALIEVASRGAAILAELKEEDIRRVSEFGALLGYAFQIADDILDYTPENPEKGNLVTVQGLEATQVTLKEVSETAMACLAPWSANCDSLKAIVEFNLTRTH